MLLCGFGLAVVPPSQKKVTILRTRSSDLQGKLLPGTDENLLYGLAGFWVSLVEAFIGISATHHDASDRSRTPQSFLRPFDPVGVLSLSLPLRLVPLRAVGLP